QRGAFVSMTLELKAGAAKNGAIVVSGANPIGYYWPMTADFYYGQLRLTGFNLVLQTIDFGITEALKVQFDWTTIIVIGGVVALVVIVAAVAIKLKK
ncbi:MAG: hypothetical protein QXQ81_01085, partial [Candidatus Thorarchaeota archaeon]